MTAAHSKHHTDVNSVLYLCAAICVAIDLVLSNGILRNLLILMKTVLSIEFCIF